jgi:hypothetical protein
MWVRFRDLAALRYREGATTYLAVATAEQSYANLYEAVGGGRDAQVDALARN